MKPVLLESFYKVFDLYKPKTLCEIGTHNAKSAVQFIDYCIKFNSDLSYTGYDVFDDVKNNTEFHSREINGKGAGNFRIAKKSLDHRQNKFKNFQYKLIKGYTVNTLTSAAYDFVYIDGGHSYETVKHDYSKLKESKLIIFDDYQTEGVKLFIDELFDELSYPTLEWEDALSYDKTCVTFLPIKNKHIQAAILKR